jgi:hypothetical protein
MNKLITSKITLILFFVIICHFAVYAQDSTKKVIVVVRPGGIVKNAPKGTATASNISPSINSGSAILSPDSQANNKFAASAPGAPGSGTLQKPAAAVAEGGATGVQKATVAAAPVPHKKAVTPYVAPGSRIHSYASPSTAERAGTSTYAPHAVVPPSKQGAPIGSGTATPGNAGKYAAAAPSAPASTKASSDSSKANASKAATVTPPALSVAAVTPVIAPTTKKDTVVVTKTDTVVVPPAKHTGNKILFAEIGGAGIAISINYDMRFKKGQKDGFGFRGGIGYFAAGNNTVFTVPLQVNYLYGKDGTYLELGLGGTFVNSRGDNYSSPVWEFDTVTGMAATATIGVRYEPNKALNFRLGYVPIYSTYGFTNAGGFSIGYTF